MSDSRASSWLNMGASAARAGDKADALFYLERAQLCEPTIDERAQISYWLSRITDDPAKRRLLLQDVVIAMPGHAEARRELAILDGRLNPRDVVDPFHPVAAHAPTPMQARRYTCPQCGGRLAFDAARGALACDFCGHHSTAFYAPGGDDVIQDQDFLAVLPTRRGQTWELPADRWLNCQGCGAAFTLPPAQATAACPFCGSPHVASATPGSDLISPEAVLPFTVSAADAARQISRWLAGQDGGPRGLARKAVAGDARPLYLPFWSFTVMGQVTWNGLIHSRYDEPPQSTSGAEAVLLDETLVPATHRLPRSLLSGLSDFDLSALQPYSPDLLADWPVEIYQITLADASLVARQRARNETVARIRSSVGPGEAIQSLSCDSSGIVVDSYKLILLPVWLAAFRLNGADYQVVLNGQSGRVCGQKPESGIKRLFSGLLEGG